MKGCGRCFTKRKWGGREVQRHLLGLIPQSIPKPLRPSRAGKGAGELGAPRALGTAGMLCQDKAPVLSSACTSRIPGVRLSFTKSPSFLKRLKLCFQKSHFLIVSLLLPPAPLPIFSPLHPSTHPPLLAVIQLFPVHTWRGPFLLSKPWELLFVLIRNE